MPERAAPTPYDEAIAGIVAARQMAFRQTNAFPPTTSLTYEERQEIIEGLPPLGAPNAMAGRLSAAATHGMYSLDLARTNNMGDWESGAALDRQVKEFFDKLREDPELQRTLGVTALSGYIGREALQARPEVTVTSLGPELDDLNIFHVIRMRHVAHLAITATGQPMIVRKRSDFRLGGVRGLPQTLARQALLFVQPDHLQQYLPRISDEENETSEETARMIDIVAGIKRNFLVGIERAIRSRPDWLYPINMNHHAKVDPIKPLQTSEKAQ